jgi:hypothetical protein
MAVQAVQDAGLPSARHIQRGIDAWKKGAERFLGLEPDDLRHCAPIIHGAQGIPYPCIRRRQDRRGRHVRRARNGRRSFRQPRPHAIHLRRADRPAGRRHVIRPDMANSRAQAEQALAICPNLAAGTSARSHSGLLGATEKRGLRHSKHAFGSTRVRRPWSPYRWLASARGELGQTAEAKEVLEKAIPVSPSTFRSANAHPGFGQRTTPTCSTASEKPVGRADDLPRCW